MPQEKLTLEQKIARARKWIEDIRKLSEEALTPDDRGKLVDLAAAAEALLEGYDIDYDENVEKFLAAIRASKNVRVKSPLLSFRMIIPIFSFVIKNLWNLFIGRRYLYVDRFPHEEHTEYFRNYTDLDDLKKTLPKIKREKVVGDFFEDRTIADESAFKQKQEKDVGATSGVSGFVKARKCGEV